MGSVADDHDASLPVVGDGGEVGGGGDGGGAGIDGSVGTVESSAAIPATGAVVPDPTKGNVLGEGGICIEGDEGHARDALDGRDGDEARR